MYSGNSDTFFFVGCIKQHPSRPPVLDLTPTTFQKEFLDAVVIFDSQSVPLFAIQCGSNSHIGDTFLVIIEFTAVQLHVHLNGARHSGR